MHQTVPAPGCLPSIAHALSLPRCVPQRPENKVWFPKNKVATAPAPVPHRVPASGNETNLILLSMLTPDLHSNERRFNFIFHDIRSVLTHSPGTSIAETQVN
jgi:hypothetical protein